MSDKRKSEINFQSCKKRRSITIETKLDIIQRYEKGEKFAVIARAYGMNESTIRTVVKHKDRIMQHVGSSLPMHSTVISKKRGRLMEEMEELLTVWMEELHQQEMPISYTLIQEKALTFFKDLKRQHGESAADASFNASHGWFHRFKARFQKLNEVANGFSFEATEFPRALAEIIENEDYVYLPEQIFNVEETGLYWKRMPDRSLIAEEEKTIPGYKASKDRLTLLLGGNAAGDCKIKPMLVYHRENPRALNNITKASLPVVWKSNPKAAVTEAIFQDWFFHHFVHDVEKYCKENNLPFKILLLVDNAPGHPASLCDYHENIKVMYLPPNATSFIQPMDQGVTQTFKKYYLRQVFRQAVKATEEGISLKQFWAEYNVYQAVKNIDAAWCEITPATMNSVWEKLTPQFVQNFTGFEEQDIINNLIELSWELGLNLQENDFNELLQCHSNTMSNEDLAELEDHREEDVSEEEIHQPKRFEAKKMVECFNMIDKGLAGLEAQDPNTERFTKVFRAVQDALTGYKGIYDEKKKATAQTVLEKYLSKTE